MQRATREVVVSASLATLITETINVVALSSLFAYSTQQNSSGGAALAVKEVRPPEAALLHRLGAVVYSSSIFFFFLFGANFMTDAAAASQP